MAWERATDLGIGNGKAQGQSRTPDQGTDTRAAEAPNLFRGDVGKGQAVERAARAGSSAFQPDSLTWLERDRLHSKKVERVFVGNVYQRVRNML
jgi:hypothetical protein